MEKYEQSDDLTDGRRSHFLPETAASVNHRLHNPPTSRTNSFLSERLLLSAYQAKPHPFFFFLTITIIITIII